MIKSRFIERHSNVIGRIIAIFIAVFFTCGGFAQEKMVRPIRTDKAPKDVTVRTTGKGTSYFVIAIDKEKKIYDIDKVPEGIEVKRYLLVDKTYMETVIDGTTKEECGDMVFDQDTLPFNKPQGAWFSYHRDKETLAKHTPLEAQLFVERHWSRYADSIVEKYKDRKDGVYEELKDSLFNPVDTCFISIVGLPNGNSVPFKLVVNDVELIEHEALRTNEKGLRLDESMRQYILPSIPFDSELKVSKEQAINRIQVIVDGHVPSFIKKVSLVVADPIVDENAKPNIPDESQENWLKKNWWIVLLALALVALCFVAYRFFSKSKPKGKQRKKITFKLSNYLTDNNYNEVVGKLRTSSDPSMNFKEDPEDKVVSFVVTDGNAALFAESIEKQQGFFYELKKCIEEAKPDNLPKQKKNAFEGEIRAAKEQLKEIGDFVTRLLGKKDEAGKGEQADEIVESLPQTSEELEKELEEYKEAFRRLAEKLELDKGLKFDEAATKLEKAVENWAGVKKALALETPKDSSAVVNRISTLEKEVDDLNTSINWLRKEKEEQENIVKDWKKQTGYNEPEKAKKDIENIEKIKKAPRSFKGDKDFKKLSDLIVDAEEGSKVRDNMNNDPSAIDPNSATGILVRKGRLFDKYVVIIADEIFKKKDAEIIIEDKIKNCPIATQVRKGNFLDKAKDDVAMIRKDEEGWLGDCELKTFIEYIVNPHEILKSKTRTNTGLYKLMNDVESVIRPNNENHRAINMSDLQYNWLKDRMGNVMDNYNYLLLVERFASEYIAFKLGAAEPDTSNLKGDVKEVFDDAKSYVKFNKYKLYWKNIAGPLFDTLDGLPAHDEIHNTRALMFYTSQFYSIACIMNEIYGDLSYSTIRPNLNVGLFNTNAAPVPTHMGFPQLDGETLQKCKFEYKGASDEDAKVKYLKQYKPLPFILVFSYFDDNTLS